MTSKEIEELIANGLPPLPADVDDWIYTECIENAYLLHIAASCTCTRCGKVWDEPRGYKGLHGVETCCPKCGVKATRLDAWRGRKKYLETFRIVIYVSSGRTLWATYWWVDADFTPFGRPKLSKAPKAVYRLDSENQNYFKKQYDYWTDEEWWEEIKEIRIPSPPRGMSYSWMRVKYDPLYVYLRNTGTVFNGTDSRYLASVESKELQKLRPEEDLRYLALGLRYKSIELLLKAGFSNLALSKVKGHKSGSIYIRGDNLRKILRLPDRWIKKLRPWNPTNSQLKTFQALTEKEKEIVNEPMLKDMADFYYPNYYHANAEARMQVYRSGIEEYAPFIKWLKYITCQPWANEKNKYGSHIRDDYLDYIKTAEKLGMDITKKSALYPIDLHAAHDCIMEQYKAAKDELRDAAITMNARRTDYQIGNLMIVPALTQEDLNQESAKLCHCVKTYGDKISKGRCWIFFIRRTDAPAEPYYTMETDTDGRLVQCRGSHNCSMTDEVKAFTKGFIETLKQEVKRERKEKGLLCPTA